MAPTVVLSVADRFALIMDGLCRVVAQRQKTGLPGPLAILLWTTFRRMAVRFANLAARVHAGTLPSPARRRPRHCERSEAIQSDNPPPASPRPQPRLPRTFGWLLSLVPEIACYRSQLQHLLSDPELTALQAAGPQFGRILHPLCHILAIRLPKSPPLAGRVETPGLSHVLSSKPPPAAPDPPLAISVHAVFRR